MATTHLAGTLLRPNGSGYRGASFQIVAAANADGAVINRSIVVAGETGGYSLDLVLYPDAVYQFVPLSTGLPPAFYFVAPSVGATTDLMDLVPAGIPVSVDEGATLLALINEHLADTTPHPAAEPFVHDQVTPAATWYVPHSFNRKAAVEVIVGDQSVITDVEITDTYVYATFASPQAGQLVIS